MDDKQLKATLRQQREAGRLAEILDIAQEIGYKFNKEDQTIMGSSFYLVGLKLSDVLEIISENEDTFEAFKAMKMAEQFKVIANMIENARWLLAGDWVEVLHTGMEKEMERSKDANRQKTINDISKGCSSKMPDGAKAL